MTSRETNRVYFIDYLRGLMVLYVVLDHAMHLYAPHFKRLYYFTDFGGSMLFDVWHMHNDAIMMPMLYFLAGMFILPSLKRRGWGSFLKEKFFRWVIPFTLGVIFLVPPQRYTTYVTKKDPNMGFLDYWQNVFFTDHLWSSAFWFLAYLALLTTILLTLRAIFPPFMRMMAAIANWFTRQPILAFCVFVTIASIIMFLADIRWGPNTWLGGYKLFYVRATRFILKAILFLLGAGIAEAGILKNKELLTKIGDSWKIWASLSFVVGTTYITYSLTYFHDGAYDLTIPRHLYFGGSWADVWPMVTYYGPTIAIRTTLLSLFTCSLVMMYLSVFRKFLDKPLPKWQNLAACSFGIYIFHEPIVLLTALQFYMTNVSEYIKFLFAATMGVAVSWILTEKLRKLPGFNKVL